MECGSNVAGIDFDCVQCSSSSPAFVFLGRSHRRFRPLMSLDPLLLLGARQVKHSDPSIDIERRMHTGTALLGLLHPSLTSKFPAQPTIDTSVPFRPSRLGEVVPRQGARSLYGASWGLIGETKMASKPVAVHWFRKGLRLHDNLAFREACDGAAALYPLFIWDSNPASPESRAGSLR